MGGGLDAVEIEGRIEHRLERRDEDGEVASGSHPAMTALIATFSTVPPRQSGGICPSDVGRVRVERPRASRRTRSAVGGTIGSPSHHSRRTKSA